MSEGDPERVRRLLAFSLEAWRVKGDVCLEPDGALLLTAGDARLRVTRAAGNIPFRWMVSEAERTRGVASIAGLLRAVRSVVQPDYRPVRLRIAPLPPLPA